MVAMKTTPTATQILDAAQALAQTRGYNAFSYRDLAERVGIRTASIHYHFPAKADLGRALLQRYAAAIDDALREIDHAAPGAQAAPERLRRYARLLEGVLLDGGRVCLGGMMAAEFVTLPEPLRGDVSAFIEANERWLAAVLSEGRAAGVLRFAGEPRTAAAGLFAALEGALFTARGHGDPDRYREVARWLIDLMAQPQG
jgi:TetR/AcrR family transcriptional repressor of nem operon